MAIRRTFWIIIVGAFLILIIDMSIPEREAENEVEENKTFSEIERRLYNGDVHQIKLIGDSITSGVGIPSHSVPDNGRVIFENQTGEIYREANHTADTWANHLRNYINKNFNNIEVINAGIGGKSTKWANDNKEAWLSDHEDVVFVMLGTNDRAHGDLEVLEKNLSEFLSYVEAHSNTMIVMSPPPSSTDIQYKFGAEEINDVTHNIAEDHEYIFISHFDHFNKYVDESDKSITDLIHSEGTHPIESGYQLIWDKIKIELGL